MLHTRLQNGWRAIQQSFHSDTSSLALFQLCLYGVLLMVVGIFVANYPAGLPVWRFYGTEFALIALLVLNLFWANPGRSLAKEQPVLWTWSFLSLSIFLILGAVWLSSQFDLVYLITLVCIQANFTIGVWPGGALFSAANLAAWLALQILRQASFSEIVGRESSLAVGIVFGLLVVALLQRSAHQTKQSQALLQELEAANRQLAAANRQLAAANQLLQTVNQELDTARLKEKELAAAEERVRLARELHDSVTQSIYTVSLYAEAAAEWLHSGDLETALKQLGELRDTAQEALREMRLLIFELRRPALEASGLAAALQARLEMVEARGGIGTELKVEGSEQISPSVQVELYAIIQEALNNVLKHAHAQHVRVGLRFEEGSTTAEVLDDGIGFAPGADPAGSGFGLLGMKERAQKIQSELRIESAPGQGTRIKVRVPVRLAQNLDAGTNVSAVSVISPGNAISWRNDAEKE